jgi:hypothetical protein
MSKLKKISIGLMSLALVGGVCFAMFSPGGAGENHHLTSARPDMNVPMYAGPEGGMAEMIHRAHYITKLRGASDTKGETHMGVIASTLSKYLETKPAHYSQADYQAAKSMVHLMRIYEEYRMQQKNPDLKTFQPDAFKHFWSKLMGQEKLNDIEPHVGFRHLTAENVESQRQFWADAKMSLAHRDGSLTTNDNADLNKMMEELEKAMAELAKSGKNVELIAKERSVGTVDTNHLGWWSSFKSLVGLGPKKETKPAATPAAPATTPTTPATTTTTPAEQPASKGTEKTTEEKSTTDKLKDGAKNTWNSASEGLSSGWRKAKGWFSSSDRHRILKHMSAEQIAAVSAYAKKNHLGWWSSFKSLVGLGPKKETKPAATPAAPATTPTTPATTTTTPAEQPASKGTEKTTEEKSTTDKLKDGAKNTWNSASEGLSSGWRKAKGWFSSSDRHRILKHMSAEQIAAVSAYAKKNHLGWWSSFKSLVGLGPKKETKPAATPAAPATTPTTPATTTTTPAEQPASKGTEKTTEEKSTTDKLKDGAKNTWNSASEGLSSGWRKAKGWFSSSDRHRILKHMSAEQIAAVSAYAKKNHLGWWSSFKSLVGLGPKKETKPAATPAAPATTPTTPATTTTTPAEQPASKGTEKTTEEKSTTDKLKDGAKNTWNSASEGLSSGWRKAKGWFSSSDRHRILKHMSAEQIAAVSAYAKKNHLGWWSSFKSLVGLGPKKETKPAATPAAPATTPTTPATTTTTPAEQPASKGTEKTTEEKSTTDKLKDGAKNTWNSASEGLSSGWRKAKGWFSSSDRHRILKHMSAEQIAAVSAYAKKNHLGWWSSFKSLVGLGPKKETKPAATPAAPATTPTTPATTTTTPAEQPASKGTEKTTEEKSTTDKLKDGAKNTWNSASEGLSSGWRKAKGWFSSSDRHRILKHMSAEQIAAVSAYAKKNHLGWWSSFKSLVGLGPKKETKPAATPAAPATTPTTPATTTTTPAEQPASKGTEKTTEEKSTTDKLKDGAKNTWNSASEGLSSGWRKAKGWFSSSDRHRILKHMSAEQIAAVSAYAKKNHLGWWSSFKSLVGLGPKKETKPAATPAAPATTPTTPATTTTTPAEQPASKGTEKTTEEKSTTDKLKDGAKNTWNSASEGLSSGWRKAKGWFSSSDRHRILKHMSAEQIAAVSAYAKKNHLGWWSSFKSLVGLGPKKETKPAATPAAPATTPTTPATTTTTPAEQPASKGTEKTTEEKSTTDKLKDGAKNTWNSASEGLSSGWRKAKGWFSSSDRHRILKHMSAEQIAAVSAYAKKNHLGWWSSFKSLVGLGPKKETKPAATPAAPATTPTTPATTTTTPAEQPASKGTEKTTEEKSTTDKLKDGAKNTWNSASEGLSSGWRKAKGWFSSSDRHRILKHMSAEQIAAVSAYAKKNHLGWWSSFKSLVGLGPKKETKPAATPAAPATTPTTPATTTTTPAEQPASKGTEKTTEEKSTTDKLKDGAKNTWNSASEGLSSGWRKAKGWFSSSDRHRILKHMSAEQIAAVSAYAKKNHLGWWSSFKSLVGLGPKKETKPAATPAAPATTPTTPATTTTTPAEQPASKGTEKTTEEKSTTDKLKDGAKNTWNSASEGLSSGWRKAKGWFSSSDRHRILKHMSAEQIAAVSAYAKKNHLGWWSSFKSLVGLGPKKETKPAATPAAPATTPTTPATTTTTPAEQPASKGTEKTTEEKSTTDKLKDGAKNTWNSASEGLSSGWRKAKGWFSSSDRHRILKHMSAEQIAAVSAYAKKNHLGWWSSFKSLVGLGPKKETKPAATPAAPATTPTTPATTTTTPAEQPASKGTEKTTEEKSTTDKLKDGAKNTWNSASEGLSSGWRKAKGWFSSSDRHRILKHMSAEQIVAVSAYAQKNHLGFWDSFKKLIGLGPKKEPSLQLPLPLLLLPPTPRPRRH